MKRILCLVALSLCLTPFINLSADLPVPPRRNNSSSSDGDHPVVGIFPIIGFAHHDSVVLNDNKIYRPLDKSFAKVTDDWNIGDPVKVLKTKKKHIYVLVNLNTGGTIKAKPMEYD